MSEVKELKDNMLENVTGGQGNDVNPINKFVIGGNTEIKIGTEVLRYDDRMIYVCYFITNYDSFTRYFFKRTEDGRNYVFYLDAYEPESITVDVYPSEYIKYL